MAHQHTVHCYAPGEYSETRAYRPIRADGLDRNLRNMKDIDFRPAVIPALTLVCQEAAGLQVGSRVRVRMGWGFSFQNPIAFHRAVSTLCPVEGVITAIEGGRVYFYSDAHQRQVCATRAAVEEV